MGRGSPLKDSVAKIDLPYVKAFKDRHGRARHYYRRRGFPAVALPGAPGSAEFMAAYAQAHGRVPVKATQQLQPRSINALVVEYYRSSEWADLRESTRRAYRGQIDRFREAHGNKGVAGIQTHHLEAIFHAMASTPESAANLRKRLHRIFRLAVRLGWRQDNPVTQTELRRRKTGGHTPWSEADIDAFEKHWPSGSRERLAMALLLYTGQRRSDVVTMGRQHVSGGHISVSQVKTDARLKIRIHPTLQHEIDARPPGLTFLLTSAGKPFTAAGFTNWFHEKTEDAGLNRRSAHGLRKAAGRRLAEAGCTPHQIAAILGHATLGMVSLYTKDANQARLADEAMDRLEAITGTPGV
jgi:integrase